MIDLSWKWRQRRAVKRPTVNLNTKKMIVSVEKEVKSFPYIDKKLTGIFINTDNDVCLFYTYTYEPEMSYMAYILAFKKMWNERLIERKWDNYSKPERNAVEETFIYELTTIDDIWLQYETIDDITRIAYYELVFSGSTITDIIPIKNPRK